MQEALEPTPWSSDVNTGTPLARFLQKMKLPLKVYKGVIQAEPDAEFLKCYYNCKVFVTQNPDHRMMAGWSILQWEEGSQMTDMFQLEHHAVVLKPNGHIIDPTPDPYGETRRSFVEDTRLSVEEMLAVKDMWAVCEKKEIVHKPIRPIYSHPKSFPDERLKTMTPFFHYLKAKTKIISLDPLIFKP